MRVFQTSLCLLTGLASACATDLDLETAESELRAVTLSCNFSPGSSLPTPGGCSPADPARISSITFSAATNFTGLLTQRSWKVTGPGGSGTTRVRGCRSRDTECEVLAQPLCIDGAPLPDGSSRLLSQAYTGSYAAGGMFSFLTGDIESAAISGIVPPVNCREVTAQLPPAFPTFVLNCVLNGAPYSAGSNFCLPNTPRSTNTIEFFIPSLPSIPREFLRFEWDTFDATVMAGCGPTNHTCLLRGFASNLGDRGQTASVTVVDTRFETWSSAAAFASMPAVCGKQFC